MLSRKKVDLRRWDGPHPLDVDADSLTGATDLYLQAGMRVDRENVLFEKILQEGESPS